MSTPRSSARICWSIDAPPYSGTTLRPRPCAYLWIASATCIASSRVGTSTRPRGLLARVALVGDALEHRQRERRRLSGAGCRLRQQIAAREHQGNGFALDRRRLFVAELGEGGDKRSGEAERSERRGGHQKEFEMQNSKCRHCIVTQSSGSCDDFHPSVTCRILFAFCILHFLVCQPDHDASRDAPEAEAGAGFHPSACLRCQVCSGSRRISKRKPARGLIRPITPPPRFRPAKLSSKVKVSKRGVLRRRVHQSDASPRRLQAAMSPVRPTAEGDGNDDTAAQRADVAARMMLPARLSRSKNRGTSSRSRLRPEDACATTGRPSLPKISCDCWRAPRSRGNHVRAFLSAEAAAHERS